MRFLETDFAPHLGGFGHYETLPFAGLKANETNHGDLRLRPRVDARLEQNVTIQEDALRRAGCKVIRSENC